ncbi:ankyrin repeat-containing domain protein [Neocallimastix lanati (nom. inval.)]|nr:ankyrin repeat-containing domain protein [Neocallimastix sp. JGI-2020a]
MNFMTQEERREYTRLLDEKNKSIIENVNKLENIILETLDFNEIVRYFQENDIKAKNYSNFEKIIIHCIEKDVSYDIIKFLFSQMEHKDANICILDNKVRKVALSIAIGKSNFKVADLFMSNGADINSHETLTYLIEKGLLNKRNLIYTLNSGYRSMPSVPLVCSLIKQKKNDCIRYLFSYFKYNLSFILSLLNLYKKCQQTTFYTGNWITINKQFNDILLMEKNKFEVSDSEYDMAIKHSNFEILRTLFEYDNGDKTKLLNRIVKYNLLDYAVRDQPNYSYIEKLLKYKPFNYHNLRYKVILLEALSKFKIYEPSEQSMINSKYLLPPKLFNENFKILKLLIKTFIYSSSKEDQHRDRRHFDIIYLITILNLAIENNNILATRFLFEEYKISLEEINTKDICGNFPIFIAVIFGRNTFKYLLEHGADPNTKNVNGVPLLSMAIHFLNYHAVQELLEFNVNINDTDPNGILPLDKAINFNSTEITKCLIDYSNKNNININTGEIRVYLSPSHHHSISPSLRPIKKTFSFKNESGGYVLLRKFKSNKNLKEKKSKGNYPLIKAINQNNIDIVFSIVDYCISNKIDLNINDVDGETPLTLSYKKNYYNIFRYLVEYLDINRPDSNGNTVLYYAIGKNDVDTINEIISVGGDVNFINVKGDSTLDYALNTSNSSVVRELIEKGDMMLNQKNNQGQTPLITIINSNRFSDYEKESITRLLITFGANIHMTDKEGNTPLIYAIINTCPMVLRLLLKFGSNVYLKNRSGKNALDYAVIAKDFNITCFLYDFGYDIYHIKNMKINFETFSRFIHDNDIALFQLIININRKYKLFDLDINIRNHANGNTLLHEAVLSNNPMAAKLLKVNGVKTNIKNNNGKTAHDINYEKNSFKNQEGNIDFNEIYYLFESAIH